MAGTRLPACLPAEPEVHRFFEWHQERDSRRLLVPQYIYAVGKAFFLELLKCLFWYICNLWVWIIIVIYKVLQILKPTQFICGDCVLVLMPYIFGHCSKIQWKLASKKVHLVHFHADFDRCDRPVPSHVLHPRRRPGARRQQPVPGTHAGGLGRSGGRYVQLQIGCARSVSVVWA